MNFVPLWEINDFHKTQVAILEKLQLSEEDTFYAYSAESNKDMEKIHDIVEELIK